MSQNSVGCEGLKKCRLCLYDNKRLIYLFEDSGLLTYVAKAIMEVLRYEVFKDDRFPPYICSSCSVKLWEFKAFKEKCDNAKESFESFLLKEPLKYHGEHALFDTVIVKEEPLLDETSSSPNSGNAVNTRVQSEKLNVVIVKEEPIVDDTSSSPNSGDAVNLTLQAEKLDAVIVKEEPIVNDTSSSPNSGDAVNTTLQAEKATSGPIRLKEEFGIFDIENQETYGTSIRNDNLMTKKLVSCSRKDDEKIVGSSNFQVFAERIVAEKSEDGGVGCEESNVECYKEDSPSEFAEDNAGVAMEHVESIVKEEPQSQEEADAQVLGRVLHPRGARSCWLNQLENAQSDQSSYEVSPDEMSTSDAEETLMIEGNVYWESAGTKADESLSRYPYDFASTSRNSTVAGVLSDGLRNAECLSDSSWAGSMEMDVPKEGNEDPLWSGNQTSNDEKGKSFLCEKCGKKLKTKGSLRAHILGIHSNGELYVCKVCKEAFKARHHLYQHSLCHRETPRFHCRKCPKGFHCKQMLTKHLRTHGLKPSQCMHCGADFERKGQLVKHYPVHDGEVDWTCDACGEKYEKWRDLAVHKTTHQVKGVFKCATCGVEYSNKGDLRRHTYRHTRPHSCPTCSKAFATNHHLYRHTLTHTQLKPYRCNICRKGFNQKGNFMEHLKSHSEERPFPCKHCSYCGKTERALRSHELQHSTYKPYQCSFCYRTYASNYRKRRHERKSHENKMAQ